MTSAGVLPALELWGGVECTINRVGERYHDQLQRSGHLERPTDIDAFAELGLVALRVPILWERTVRAAGAAADFSCVEPMLARARSRGLRTIAGLVHHGSGPSFTHLLDPNFEHDLARYAAEVARNFSFITEFTPVNEPLTTARFSCLYGLWYPHVKDPRSFVRALLHECRATVRAMRAIREVRPDARLVQTEDIGTVFSTPLLAYQAEYENHRRFLSLDLLCGRVNKEHPLHDHLLANGATADELSWLVDNPCPPDVIGIDYYFTSDRHLDENRERYPEWSWGGNGRHTYADTDLLHVPERSMVGHRGVIQAVWDRYQTPVALTEVHAGCTREEQLRWLHEAYRAAVDARKSGIAVQAVTAWALLGSFDWNSLVTVERGVYESGAFDLRGRALRPTAVAAALRSLATSGEFSHPVLSRSGFWHRGKQSPPRSPSGARCHVLITGARGTLAQAFAKACEVRGLSYVVHDRSQLDIANAESVEACLREAQPWAVVNAAGYVRVDEAEQDAERCLRENVSGPATMADVCRKQGARLLTFSSDLVFDGKRSAPYLEHSLVAPLSVYGRSKAQAERAVLEHFPDAMVVRTSAFFGPWDEVNFVTNTLNQLREGRSIQAAHDAVVSPTYVPHLVQACLDLLIDGATGLWHLANVGSLSWSALALLLARLSGHPETLVQPCAQSSLIRAAPRPPYSVLGSARARLMPTLEEGLECYFKDRRSTA